MLYTILSAVMIPGTSDERAKSPYHFWLFEQLLTLCSQFEWHDGSLPTGVTSTHFDSHGTADDLMSETYANGAHAILSQYFGNEVNELEGPRVVLKGVMFCHNSQPDNPFSKDKLYSRCSDILEPVRRIASTSSRFG